MSAERARRAPLPFYGASLHQANPGCIAQAVDGGGGTENEVSDLTFKDEMQV